LTVTIAKDLKLTKNEIANSNIVALVATLLVRLVAGPACDRFGARKTFAGCLLVGAIPTFLSGTAYNASELMALRFFIGILGGSFVPCQVWSTGFFDKNVVGSANAFTAGFGNAGGGITYFLTPAIFDLLVSNHRLTPHVAWRVVFVVPGICITAVALGLLFLCPDTPTGKWSDRHLSAQQNLAAHGVTGIVIDAPGSVLDKKFGSNGAVTLPEGSKEQYVATTKRRASYDHEAQLSEQAMLDTARGEIIVKPTFKEAMSVTLSLQTLVTTTCYFCSFGSELAINSILGAYYLANFKHTLNQRTSGDWASMFGLLNVFFRPIGGLVADVLYRRTGSVWAKKIWLHALGLIAGAFLVATGVINPHDTPTMFGLVAGSAFFIEAGNGANFALVPHVHPHANGIVSGVTGAAGNLGGIIFAVIFRFDVTGKVTDYGKSLWIIGVIMMAMNVAVCWIKPVPKNQIGGR
jgi:NNP family nitrate/nitrite transporter-like MFS transporter